MKKTLKTLLYGSIFALASLLPYKVHAAEQFIRGDTNQDEIVDISDSINTLEYLFLGKERPECMDAADIDDNGKIEVTDAVYGLEYMFKGGQKPPAPFPNMGYDVTKDGLDCRGQSDLESRIIMQRDIPLVIRESGTPERPLVYILGEDLEFSGEGSTIKLDGVRNVIFDGLDHIINYGKINSLSSYGISCLDCENVEIMNFKLMDINSPNTGRNYGIEVRNSVSTKITNNDIKTSSIASAAIYVKDDENLEILNNNILTSGGGEGIILWNIKSSKITGNNIENKFTPYYTSGIYVRESDKNLLLNNIIFIHPNFDWSNRIYDVCGLRIEYSNRNEFNNIKINSDNSNNICIASSENNNLENIIIKSITKSQKSESLHYMMKIEPGLANRRISLNMKNSEFIPSEFSKIYDLGILDETFGDINFYSTNFNKNNIFFGVSSDINFKVYYFIDIKVKDMNNNPLPNTQLNFYKGPIPPEIFITDSIGHFHQSFLSYEQNQNFKTNVPQYKIQAIYQDYIPSEKEINLDNDIYLEFILEPISK